MIYRAAAIAALAAAIAGCVSVPDVASSLPGQLTASQAAANQITFIDTEAFDTSLSNSLGAQLETVEIVPLVDFPINKIPERINLWLNVVASNGGKVDTNPRRFSQASVVVDLLSAAYAKIQQNMMYQPAANYDVTLHYVQSSGSVQKLVFTKKPASPTTPAPLAPVTSQPVAPK